MEEQDRPTKVVRQLRGGQITIPVAFRRKLGIDQEAFLEMTLIDGELRIRPLGLTQSAAGSAWFRQLYDYFAPTRAEAEAKNYTDEEINTAIDQATAAVRRKRA